MFPFQALLDEIALEDVQVGVREHLALGKLIQRYDGYSRSQFRDAVAALLGTNVAEVRRIEAAFDRLYPEPEVEAAFDRLHPELEAVSSPSRIRVWRWRTYVGLAVIAVVSIVIGVWRPWRVDPVVPPNPVVGPTPKGSDAARRLDEPCAEVAARTYGETSTDLNTLAAGAFAGFALILAASAARGRRRLRRWRHDASRALSASIAGPRDYRVAIKQAIVRDERAAYGPLATALRRAASEWTPTSELDVQATLRETVRGFPRIRFAFRARRVPQSVVVLEDTAPDMAPWRAKVEALVAGLRRDGLSIVRLYFRHDIARVSTLRDGAYGVLADHGRAHPGAPLVVISWSGVVPADVVKPWPARLWLSPVADQHLWPASVRGESIWPITRSGLLGAAHALAGRGRDRPVLDDAPAVSPRDTRLFAALLGLAPAANFELAELVRARLFPCAPDELVLAARGWVGGAATPDVRATLRELDPDGAQEREMRKLLVSLLDGSEPARDCAAHLRWRRDRSLQLVALGDEAGARELQALAASPLADELVVHVEASAGAVPKALRREVATTAARPDGLQPRRLAWPHLGAVLLATSVFAVGVGASRHQVPRVMPRFPGYSLAASGTTPSGAVFSVTRLLAIAPNLAALYRDQKAYIQPMYANATLTLTPGAAATCYQVEAIANDVQFVSNTVRVGPVEPPPQPPSGSELVERKGCTACHALDGKRVGPPLKGMWRRAVDGTTRFTNGQALSQLMGPGKPFADAEDYLRQKIANTTKLIVKGYLAVQPAPALKTAEMDAIVAYLKALEPASPPLQQPPLTLTGGRGSPGATPPLTLTGVTPRRGPPGATALVDAGDSIDVNLSGVVTFSKDTRIQRRHITIAGGAMIRVLHGATLILEAEEIVVAGLAVIDGTGDAGAPGKNVPESLDKVIRTRIRDEFDYLVKNCPRSADGERGGDGGPGATIRLRGVLKGEIGLAIHVEGGKGGAGGRGALGVQIVLDPNSRGEAGRPPLDPWDRDIQCPNGRGGPSGNDGPTGAIYKGARAAQ